MVSFKVLSLAVLSVLASTAVAHSHHEAKRHHGLARMDVDKRGKQYYNKIEKVGTGIVAALEGELSGGIGSWFQADSGRDSTNGRSWCGIPYTDSDPLFAPNFKLISPTLATWSGSPQKWEEDGKRACGLEAELTYKGKTVIAYVGDVFDPAWVRTRNSVDILKGTWEELAGKSADSKEQVLQGLTWKLTGNRNQKYAFQG